MALVTNAGLANVMAAWNAYASRPIWLQFGTGSGQLADANDLAAPVQLRVTGISTQTTTTVTGDTLQITGSITATDNNTITEVGLFDAGAGGNLDIYGDFTGIDLVTGDGITFSVTITVS